VPTSYTYAIWARPDECLWDVPIGATTRHPLSATYQMVLGCETDELAMLSSFFQGTLHVACVNWFNEAVQVRGFQAPVSSQPQQDQHQTMQLVRLLQGLNELAIATNGCAGEAQR
jgi:hypothetical protein